MRMGKGKRLLPQVGGSTGGGKTRSDPKVLRKPGKRDKKIEAFNSHRLGQHTTPVVQKKRTERGRSSLKNQKKGLGDALRIFELYE